LNTFLLALTSIDGPYILFLVLGTIAGYVVGALPGFSATMGVAIFVPFTYSMTPNIAFAFLIGLYCSAVFAGSIPAVLIRTPGTPAAICTIYDGYPMAKRGEAGRALGLACLASVFGGLFSAIILIAMAGLIAKFALSFGPWEYFMLGLLGLSLIISMSADNMIKGLISGIVGLCIPLVGLESMNGYARFTFGNVQLLAGFQELPVMIGLFAISEVFIGYSSEHRKYAQNQKISGLFSGLKDMLNNKWLLIKSALMGTYLGALPGVGATTAAIIGYDLARKGSKEPEKMGTGQPEGIIGPECANNAVTCGALIPMLALGIPGDPVTAILLGSLMIHGLQPGPLLFQNSPVIVKSIYISLILSYVVILLFSTISINVMAKLLNVKTSILNAFVLLFCIIGSYALRNSYFDVYVACAFGFIGYWMRKDGYSLGPLTLSLVLGSMMEQKLSAALRTSSNALLFITRPISGVMFVLTFAIIVVSIYKYIKGGSKSSNEEYPSTSQLL